MLSINKKLVKIALCAILTLLMCVVFVACNGEFQGTLNKNPILSQQTPKATSFVAIDINPSVEIVLDQYNRVMCVSGANTDGQILLWEEDGLVDAELNVAIKKLVTVAIECGYISNDNHSINVSIVSTEDNRTDVDNKTTILSAIESAIASAVLQANCDFDVSIENATDLVLSNELDTLKIANLDNEDIANLDLEKYRLIKTALACDETLAVESAVKMSVGSLIAIIQPIKAEAVNKLGDAYKKAQDVAIFAYNMQKQSLQDSLYISFLTDRCLHSHSFAQAIDYSERIVASVQYKTLHTLYFLFDEYQYSLNRYYSNPTYSQDDATMIFESIDAVIDDLDIDKFMSAVKDEDGNITLNNIKSYFNSLYRTCTSEKREQLESVYNMVKANILDNIVIDDALISQMRTSIDEILQDMPNLVPDAVRAYMSQILDDAFVFTLPNDLQFDDVESVERTMLHIEDLMQRAYSDMHLTTNDLQAISNMHISIESDLEALKTLLDEQLTQAKDLAKEYFSNAKQMIEIDK